MLQMRVFYSRERCGDGLYGAALKRNLTIVLQQQNQPRVTGIKLEIPSICMSIIDHPWVL